jgi:hypothetical protein
MVISELNAAAAMLPGYTCGGESGRFARRAGSPLRKHRRVTDRIRGRGFDRLAEAMSPEKD